MASISLTKRILLSALTLFAFILAGCAGTGNVALKQTAADVSEPRASEDAMPAKPVDPAATATHDSGPFKPITIQGTIHDVWVADGFEYFTFNGFETNHADVPAGAVKMTADLVWTTSSWFVGAYQDVPAQDLNMYVKPAVGSTNSTGNGGGWCTNFAPLPDPLGGPCNRDRSEQLIIEGLEIGDAGQWHVYVGVHHRGGPYVVVAPDAFYTVTLTFE